MNKIKIIAAVGMNNELGKNNDLIWKLKEDLNFFKNETMNKTIVMGYKTYKSLPGLLKGRKHIVLTHNKIDNNEVLTFDSIDKLKEYLPNINDDIYIIGGATVYKIFIDICDEIVLTEINETCENADVYFPKFDKNKFDKIIINSLCENNITYKHVKYLKIK